MSQVLSIFQFITSNGPQCLAALVTIVVALIALFHALIGLFMMIPGAQPEAALQKIIDKLQAFVDFVSKFSKK